MIQEMSKIIELINRQAYPMAIKEIHAQLQTNPNSFDLYKALSVVLMIQNKSDSAISSLQKARILKPDDYDVNVNLAYLYNKKQDYKLAIQYSEYALKINQNKPEAYHNLAHSFLYVANIEEAEKNMIHSIKLRGGIENEIVYKTPDIILLYLDILQAKGDLDLEKEITMNILNKGIFIGDIYRRAIRINKKLITDQHLSNIHSSIRVFEKLKNKIKRNFAIASAYSCLAEYYQKIDQQKSEIFYFKSNQFIMNTHNQSVYDNQKFIKKIIKFSNEINLTETKTNNFLGEGLIFVIGMPRSGTTLLESILATAENTVAGGEKIFFHDNCNKILKNINTSEIEDDFFVKLGEQYLNIIDIQRRGCHFFIDKLPDNYFNYNIIRKSLPGAKFINIHRDPWDNAISIYKANFQQNLFWSSSFFGIAMQYANYEHLMKIWKNQKNEDIFEVNYSDLVSDTKECIKNIWDFCDLKGKYDENLRKKHFAQTASKNQVTQKIYTTSLKKDEFHEHKDGFLKDLEQQRQYWIDAS